MTTMRADLTGLLRNAARALRKPDPVYAQMIAFGLEEAAQHVEQVRSGVASLAEFCEHYNLPPPITVRRVERQPFVLDDEP
jgi:hypothetical protein